VSSINSYSKLIIDFQSLVTRAADYEAELPHVGKARLELQASLQELQAIKDRQEHHWWAWRQASKELLQGMATGRFVAGWLRSLVKEAWGRFDPRLPEFGILPLRRRREGRSAPKVNGSEQPM
jgi:hypothetical protein